MGHLRGGVAVAGGRAGGHRRLDRGEVVGGQRDARARPAPPPAARGGGRRSAARCPSPCARDPGDRELRDGDALRPRRPRAAPRPARGCGPGCSPWKRGLCARKSPAPPARSGPVPADQAAGEHAVGGDPDAELAGRSAGSRPRCRARSASTRSAGRRSGARRRRGGWSRRRPRTGRCGGRSRPAPSRRWRRWSPRSARVGSSRAGPVDVDVVDAEPAQRVRQEVLHGGGAGVVAEPGAVRARAGRRT